MKRNELTELVWNLQREYLEFDPKVEIHFRGVEFGYGRIAHDCLTGRNPEPAALRACATVCGREISSTDLRIVSVDGSTIETRTIDWPTFERRREAVVLSQHGAVVYFQERYSGKVERLVSWQEVQHLLFTKSEIYLCEVTMASANTSADDFELAVYADGQEVPADQFHWLPHYEGRILEALLNMQESVFVSGQGLTRQNGFVALVEETERWAAVVREFVARYGRTHAAALLGHEALDHILSGRGTAFTLMPTGNTVFGQLTVADA